MDGRADADEDLGMRHIAPLPDIQTLQKYLTYHPDTGELTWNAGLPYAKQRQAGRTAGTMSKGGYLRTSIERKMYANNRIAWKMYYGFDPVGVVDHEDGDKLNNRISNLRDASQRQNTYNQVRRVDNTTGYKGVVFCKIMKKFTINLRVDGVKLRRRYFETPEAANDYVVGARARLHGEFACDGERGAA